MTDLVERARVFAFAAHEREDHRRKYTGLPYSTHLEAVARLVRDVSDDEATVAAAYLHDVLEDTPVTEEELRAAFGADVAYLVNHLSDVSQPSDGNRASRKAIDRAHIASGDSRVHTIKLADLIDNARDIARNDPNFAVVYMAEKELLLKVLGDGHPELLRTAWAILTAYHNGEAIG